MRPKVSTRVSSWQSPRQRCATGSTSAPARRRHDRRSGDDLDRADRRARARHDDPAVHRPAGSHARRGRRSGRASRRRRRRRRSGQARSWGHSVTFAPGQCWGRLQSRRLRRAQEQPPRRRCEGAASLLHGRCRDRRAYEHRCRLDHRQPPPREGREEAGDRIGRDVRVGVDTVLVAPITIGDDVWTAAGSVVTEDVPDNALVGFPPRQTIKEGRGGKRDD